VYFYELHEADDNLFTDALLAHDVEYDEDQFLELVLEARAAVVETFEEDSLVEAVAAELQRRHGFLYIDDSRLAAAVNVSVNEGETVASEVVPGDGATTFEEGDYRSILVERDPEDPR
jgi:predicted acyl esterase